MADKYFITGTTNVWNTARNWSTSSGGASGATVPNTSDVAIFDNNSSGCNFNATVSILGLTLSPSFTGAISQGAFATTVGASGWSHYGGTFTGGSNTITTTGPFLLSGGTFTNTSNATGLSVQGGMTIAAGTFTGGSGGIVCSKSGVTLEFAISGGSFTSTSSNLQIGGNFTKTGGTFSHGNGTLLFQPPNTFPNYTLSSNDTLVLYNFTVNMTTTNPSNPNSLSIAEGTTVMVQNSLFHQAGEFWGPGIVELSGSSLKVGALGGNAGTHGSDVPIYLRTASNYALSGSGGVTGIIEIDKVGGSVTCSSTDFGAHRLICTNGSFTAPSGTLYIGTTRAQGSAATIFSCSPNFSYNHNNGTIYFQPTNGVPAGNYIINTGGSRRIFYNVVAASTTTTNTTTLSHPTGEEIYCLGSLTLSGKTSISGSWRFEGDFDSQSTSRGGVASITFTGSTDQLFRFTSGTMPTGTITINKSSGSVILANTVGISATGQDFIISSGTFNLSGNNLIVADTFTVNDTLIRKGNETITCNSFVMSPTTSTMMYIDSTVPVNINYPNNNTTFFNLYLCKGKTHTFNAGLTNTINGQLSFNGSSNDLLVMGSTVPTSAYRLNVTKYAYLDAATNIRDCDASGGINIKAIGSVNSGNNTNVTFTRINNIKAVKNVAKILPTPIF
jgi:hypothetical protein